MNETSDQLLGLAARIADLYGNKITVESLYGPDGSHLYHGIMRNDRAEIDDLLRLAAGRHPGPVLELACGTGRTVMPFLAEGYQVVGLDASPHMLQRLAERLQEPEWQKYANQLTTVERNMTDFALGERFDLIVLGMSTVWLLDEDQRSALFRCVREHLTDDGRFLLTLQGTLKFEEDASPFERTHTFIASDKTAPVLCTMIEYLDAREKIRLLSMVSHRVTNGEIAHSAIYTQRNHLISPETLEKEVERAGMRLVERHEISEETRVTRAADEGRRRWILEIGI
ncbi:class I SAM-dependent methyltransferase [Actinomadura craniellae]|uniref:Class I SAM-dependent methyltransferase n=1 Tax=Actinomadura craniellae TaxID=2231787 RepID=A0A365H155_9ACTN|nr:daptide-type RiPP biosynthesis methyltransferase [Actinomadura craniellae]RAY11923.1 class I SAM-dependent methyltransferase [Actinomadura craniellae]